MDCAKGPAGYSLPGGKLIGFNTCYLYKITKTVQLSSTYYQATPEAAFIRLVAWAS
jgi:hypothetical protein